jgi:hypothetical protein
MWKIAVAITPERAPADASTGYPLDELRRSISFTPGLQMFDA